MSEELGKIEKPPAEKFRKGRRLLFVPLIYTGHEPPDGYLEKFDRYWAQVEGQLADLEARLGKVTRVFHELVTQAGEEGLKSIKELNEKSYQIAQARLEKGAGLEPIEDAEIQAEFLDWSRCLMLGLQSEKAFNLVYTSYREASQRRNKHMTKKLNESLKEDEVGLLFMREGHQVQFPEDVEVFYVAPPALDELKRWLRDQKEPQVKG
jgi:hypothetical protein